MRCILLFNPPYHNGRAIPIKVHGSICPLSHCPIEDRLRLDSRREGMLEGFTLGSYLLLVDYTGRLFREGKAVIAAELGAILERLGSSAENWQARLQKLSGGRLLGRFFAATRSRLRSFSGSVTSAS
jgi:hypothetical protein